MDDDRDLTANPGRHFKGFKGTQTDKYGRPARRRSHARKNPLPPLCPRCNPDALLPSELAVLLLLALGNDAQTIADKLFITAHTVRNHLTHIYRKLGVTDRTQAVIEAHHLGLVTLPGPDAENVTEEEIEP